MLLQNIHKLPHVVQHLRWGMGFHHLTARGGVIPNGTSMGGGDPSVLDANYPPQLTVGRRPLWGGGVLGGAPGGAPGRAVPRGGGGSGTSEQLGMRPRCDPTVRTAPSHNRG